MLKRQGQSSKITNEQMQRKLAENGIYKDDLSKNIPVNKFDIFISKENDYLSVLMSTKTNIVFTSHYS